MPSFLVIDTATSACSVAVQCEGKVYSDFEMADRSHTQKLLPMIDNLLNKAGLLLSDLDAIAFTHGPGSFTGIRIGFAAVQGLSMGAKVPVIPVSTLRLMAETAVRKLRLKPGQSVYTALDARMDELYWGCYRVTEQGVQASPGDQLSIIRDAFGETGETQLRDVIGVGSGWSLLTADQIRPSRIYEDFYPEAEDLLPIATRCFYEGALSDIREVQPLYLRDTVSWKKREWLRPRD